MGKTLTKILGVAALGLMSHNLNAQNRSFIKEDYDKYVLTYAALDIDNDNIPDVIAVDYDLNSNGKRDVRGVFIITGKNNLVKEGGRGGITYYTKSKACMLIFDKDEDGKDDEAWVDTDLDGVLERHINLKKEIMI